MSPPSSVRAVAASLLGIAALLALPPVARAESAPAPAGAVYVVVSGSVEGRAQAEQVARDLSRPGNPLRPLGEPLDPGDAAVPRSRLEVLRQTEEALAEARELNAQLREAAALRVLAQAEQRLLGALEVPGVHAFLAEIYVQLGLCAAQLNEEGLFRTSLARALSLDPRRRLEAAEAPPALLSRARELAKQLDAALPSEVSVLPEPATAQVWIDGVSADARLGPVRVRAGFHLLLVRAPGYAPYTAELMLEPGRRAPMRVLLSPLPAEQARRALLTARDIDQAAPAARALSRALETPVLLLEPARSGLPKVLVHRCDSAGCELLEGRERGTDAPKRFGAPASAYAWLNAKTVAREAAPARPVWKRWPVWVTTAAVLLGGVSAALVASRPTQAHEQRDLTLDPSALPH